MNYWRITYSESFCNAIYGLLAAWTGTNVVAASANAQEKMEEECSYPHVERNHQVAEEFQRSIKRILYEENQFRSSAFLENEGLTSIRYEVLDSASEGSCMRPIDVIFCMSCKRYFLGRKWWICF